MVVASYFYEVVEYINVSRGTRLRTRERSIIESSGGTSGTRENCILNIRKIHEIKKNSLIYSEVRS